MEKHYTLQLNAKTQPMHRWDWFEDPLDEMLQESQIGGVDGGGTMMNPETGMIDFCDLEIYLDDNSQEKYEKLLKIIEILNVPKGSFLKFFKNEDDEKITEIPVGNLEGLDFALNGTELADEVYQNYDINDVIDNIVTAMQEEEIGNFYSFHEWNTHTHLFFYGKNFEKMKEIIETSTKDNPLCEKSIISQIA